MVPCSRLTVYKCPRVFVLPQLPLNATGKVTQQQLKDASSAAIALVGHQVQQPCTHSAERAGHRLMSVIAAEALAPGRAMRLQAVSSSRIS